MTLLTARCLLAFSPLQKSLPRASLLHSLLATTATAATAATTAMKATTSLGPTLRARRERDRVVRPFPLSGLRTPA
ncbi:hypothetical protein EJ04DRAFT_364102 [Polyplosphaeria fusca]|uniref:Uncharacterized protein n=1 Tax=Polyplosphaeria fusca TaxID=682080 RepID=A0A9P4QV44_9PLEO|nr:hypothetical protein EJ04DRAFT_364102 [Polyplosphaeria fusca]